MSTPCSPRYRKARLQGSLYTGWCNAPRFPSHSWKACKEELPHTGHRVCGGPRRKMCGGHVDELGELLVNKLEKVCREAQDLGYEFHYNWLIVLIIFVAWKMPKGTTFPNIEPSESLAARFSTLCYTNDMTKQWQSNVVFHAYYQQLKVSIESFPCKTPRTLHKYRAIENFHADPHFIYITMHIYENKEEFTVILQANR
jgi:hypothetical protein